MDVGTRAASRTGFASVVARGKLPDDLTLVEFADLIKALGDLAETARRYSPRSGDAAPRARPDVAAPAEVQRVQYGSDFLVLLSVAGAVGAASSGMAAAFLLFAKAINEIANYRLANEERIGKKEKRLRRRAERLAAGLDIQRLAREVDQRHNRPRSELEPFFEKERIAREHLLPLALYKAVAVQLGFPPTDDVAAALAVLGEYGIAITVENQ